MKRSIIDQVFLLLIRFGQESAYALCLRQVSSHSPLGRIQCGGDVRNSFLFQPVHAKSLKGKGSDFLAQSPENSHKNLLPASVIILSRRTVSPAYQSNLIHGGQAHE